MTGGVSGSALGSSNARGPGSPRTTCLPILGQVSDRRPANKLNHRLRLEREESTPFDASLEEDLDK